MKRGERGYALVVVLIGMLSGLAIFAASQGLRTNDSTLSKQRATSLVLHEAKSALIAYAMLEGNTPGNLPCPAPEVIENGEKGIKGEATNCESASNPIEVLGRFPWKTLGIEAPLDDANECLWYSLYYPFRNTVSNDLRDSSSAINPQTATANGLAIKPGENKALAVIFAPGRSLSGASKTSSSFSPCAIGDASSFLDAIALSGDNAAANGTVVTGPPSDTFNDLVVPLTVADLFKPNIRYVLQQLNQSEVRKWLREIPTNPPELSLATARASDTLGFDRKVTPPSSIPASTYTYPDGNCPVVDGASISLKPPVFWLCYNGWYDLIQIDTSTQTLKLPLGNGSTYSCQLDYSSGTINAKRIVCG